MATIHFSCTVCGNPVGAPRAAAGKVGKCPKCGARVAVPEESGAQLAHSLQTAPVPAVEEQPAPVSAAPATAARAQAAPASSARAALPRWVYVVGGLGLAVTVGVCTAAGLVVYAASQSIRPEGEAPNGAPPAARDYARAARRQMELERAGFYAEAEAAFNRLQTLRGDSTAYWISRRADELLAAKRRAAPQDEDFMYRRWLYEARSEAEDEWRRLEAAREAADADETRPKRSGRF